MLVCSRQCGADRDAVSVVTAGVLGLGENSAPGCCGMRGFCGVPLGSLGFRRAAFQRDMRSSISRRGVPPLLAFPFLSSLRNLCICFLVLRPLSFGLPRQRTFVSLSLSLPLSLSLFCSIENTLADSQTSVHRNRDYCHPIERTLRCHPSSIVVVQPIVHRPIERTATLLSTAHCRRPYEPPSSLP